MAAPVYFLQVYRSNKIVVHLLFRPNASSDFMSCSFYEPEIVFKIVGEPIDCYLRTVSVFIGTLPRHKSSKPNFRNACAMWVSGQQQEQDGTERWIVLRLFVCPWLSRPL